MLKVFLVLPVSFGDWTSKYALTLRNTLTNYFVVSLSITEITIYRNSIGSDVLHITVTWLLFCTEKNFIFLFSVWAEFCDIVYSLPSSRELTGSFFSTGGSVDKTMPAWHLVIVLWQIGIENKCLEFSRYRMLSNQGQCYLMGLFSSDQSYQSNLSPPSQEYLSADIENIWITIYGQ